MNDFATAYRVNVVWLVRMGFTFAEAQTISALRLAYMMYPQAFM